MAHQFFKPTLGKILTTVFLIILLVVCVGLSFNSSGFLSKLAPYSFYLLTPTVFLSSVNFSPFILNIFVEAAWLYFISCLLVASLRLIRTRKFQL